MKLLQTTTIGGVAVSKLKSFNGLTVYRRDPSVEFDTGDVTLYFVDEQQQVVQTLNIEADMGQGVGYVSRTDFVTPIQGGLCDV